MLVSLSTRLSVVLSDVLLLVATWWKTAGTRREARKAQIRTPLMTLLIRDGELIVPGLWSSTRVDASASTFEAHSISCESTML